MDEKPIEASEISKEEGAKVEEARAQLSNIMGVVLYNLKEGNYEVDKSYKPEKRGDLNTRPVQDLVKIVREIGMENFEADNSGDFPVFTHVDERGRCYRVGWDSKSTGSVSGTRHLFIGVAASPTEEPAVTMEWANRWYYREDHDSLTYSSRLPGAEGKPEIVREIKLKEREPSSLEAAGSKLLEKLDGWWTELGF